MKKILQYKFEKYTLDISEAKYEYKFYNKNETTRPEDGISGKGILDSYVELPIVLNIEVSEKQREYISSKNKELFLELENKIEDKNIFNKINDYSRDYFRYYHDKRTKNIEFTFEKYNIDETKMSDFVLHQNRGYILNVNKSLENDFLESNKKSITYESNEFLSSDSNYVSNETFRGVETFLSNPSMTLGMIPLRERISYDLSDRNGESVCVGFLIEKYNTSLDIIGNTFVFNNELFINDDFKAISQFRKVVKDKNVRYNQSYKYVVYPVFLMTVPKQNDYHLVQDLLICDSPYIVDVTCVENVTPGVPNKLFINYYKESKKLTIDWSRPFNVEGDVKGYYIYKRNSLEEPFKVIGVIDFSEKENIFNSLQTNINESLVNKTNQHLTYFEDNDYNPNKVSIYAVSSFDAHGNFSNYSEQLSVLYNVVKKKLEINLVSLSEAPLHLPNIHIPRNTKYFQYQESIEDVVPIIVNKKKLSLYCTPDFVEVETEVGRETLLKENYILNIFKLENQKSFNDVISIRNFENINNE